MVHWLRKIYNATAVCLSVPCSLKKLATALRCQSKWLSKAPSADVTKKVLSSHYLMFGMGNQQRYPRLMSYLRGIWVLPFIAILLCDTALAQRGRHTEHESPYDPFEKVVHPTPELARTPRGRAAFRWYHEQKAAGLLPQQPKSDDAQETRYFRIWDPDENEPVSMRFEHVGSDLHDPSVSGFRLWAGYIELQSGRITDQQIADHIVYLAHRTPNNAANIDPNKGAIENTIALYGEPSDADGNGIVEVLWYELLYAGAAGYVDVWDWTSEGNGADIVHVGSAQKDVVWWTSTLAHELHHLIQYNYDIDHAFVDEGMAEAGVIPAGLVAFYPYYLTYPSAYALPMYEWHGYLTSYERAALLFTYIAQRIGVRNMYAITQDPGYLTEGIVSAFDRVDFDVPLDEIIMDWHVANLLNDQSVRPEWGYETEDRKDVRASPQTKLHGSRDYALPMRTRSHAPGSPLYIAFEDMDKIELFYRAEEERHADVVRSVFMQFDANDEFVQLFDIPHNSRYSIHDQIHRGVWLIAHTDPDANWAEVTYEANWGNPQASDSLVTIVYDDGMTARPPGFDTYGVYYDIVGTSRVAVRFAPRSFVGEAGEMYLNKLWLPAYWFDFWAHFGVPAGAKRELEWFVYSHKDNEPDSVLYSGIAEDASGLEQPTTWDLQLFDVDIAAGTIGPLPDTVYIAFTPTMVENNGMSFDVSPSNQSEDVALVMHFSNGTLDRLERWWDTETVNNDSEYALGGTRNTVPPVRAQFAFGPAGTAGLQFTGGIADQSFPRAKAISPLVLPEASGGVSPIDYVLTPDLPAGLGFVGSTRTISGTPTEVTTVPVLYTYTATDANGSADSLQFNIEVFARVHFAQGIADQSFPRGQPIAPWILPEAVGGVSPISYSLNPALPTGLSFVALTRTISGTPTEVTSAPLRFTYTAIDSVGDAASSQFNIEVHSPVAAEHVALPESFSMRGNYPNPFQQSTRLVFDLPWSAWVTVEVMDLTGRRVLTVPAKRLAPGWGRSVEVMSGSGLPSGLYLYRMTVTSPEGSLSHTDSFMRIR